METKEEVRKLFFTNGQTTLKKLIERMEGQVGEVIGDDQYRTVWMPCLPLEEVRKPEEGTARKLDDPEEASTQGRRPAFTT